MVRHLFTIFTMLCTGCIFVQAHENNALTMEVLVNGAPLREYCQNGITYVEALKGKQYSIRITNHLDRRTAVALSVDGLNTIDAKHVEAYTSRKWVLDAYQSIVISGWQTDLQKARHFYFTTEEDSYGKRLGQTVNLGLISAVLFQEKSIWKEISSDSPHPSCRPQEASNGSARGSNQEKDSASSSSQGEPAKRRLEALSSEASAHDDWAATGMGDRFQHHVHPVEMELEPFPVSSVNIRYEFRPVLVKMGILPSLPQLDPMQRRQQAKGFEDSGFCPEMR